MHYPIDIQIYIKIHYWRNSYTHTRKTTEKMESFQTSVGRGMVNNLVYSHTGISHDCKINRI